MSDTEYDNIETVDADDFEDQYGGYDPTADDMIKQYKETLINIKKHLYNNFNTYCIKSGYTEIKGTNNEWCILLAKWYDILKYHNNFKIDDLYSININQELIDKKILILLHKLKDIYNSIEPEYYIELNDFLERVFKTYPYGMNEKSTLD
jgi:hypothetical protein